MRNGWTAVAVAVWVAGCGAVAETPPPPPEGAQAYRPSTGVPDAVQRAEIELLSGIDARFKPVDGELYALPAGDTFETVSGYYIGILDAWSAEPPRSARGVTRQQWTRDDRVVAIAVVERDAVTPDVAPGPILVVARSRN